MSGVSMTFKVGNGPAFAHLAKLQNRQIFTAARREIGEMFLGEIQDNLDNQKLFNGSAMKQSKAAAKRGGKTLIKSHLLYDSYVYQLKAGGLEVGSDSPYAAIHHFGGQTGSRKGRFMMPARPVMGLTPKLERNIGDFLIAEIGRMQ